MNKLTRLAARFTAGATAALLLAPASAQASTTGTAPVSPTGEVVSRAPVPLTNPTELPLEGPVPTEVFWTRWTTRVVYGQPLLIEGQVLVADGALPEAKVRLYVRPEGWQRWHLADTAVTSPETGVFVFDDHEPIRKSLYRVSYLGNLVYSSSRHQKQIHVYRRVADSMVRLADGSFSLRGSVAPTYRNRKVQLQRKTCASCAWRIVDATTTNDRSRWYFRVSGPSSRGTWYYRARVPGGSWFLTSFGDHVWYLRHR